MKGLQKQIAALKHGDPRAVAFTVVLLFFISVLWFSYTWLMPQKEDTRTNSAPFRQEPSEEDILLTQVLETEQGGIEGEPRNPFYLKPLPTPRPPRPTPGPRPVPRPKATPKPDEPEAVPTPVPPPQVETITYVFQGMLKRPDGMAVALVSIPKEARNRYVREGQELAPFTVMKVYQEGVEIRRGDDPPILLQRGEPQTFELEP